MSALKLNSEISSERNDSDMISERQEGEESPTNAEPKRNSTLNRGFIQTGKSVQQRCSGSLQSLKNILDFKDSEDEPKAAVMDLDDASPINQAHESDEISDITWDQALPPIQRAKRVETKRQAKEFLRNIKAEGYQQYLTHRLNKKW